MPRGGRRAGTPGKNYGQRSDLNQVRKPSGPPAPPAPNLTQQPGPAQPAQPTMSGAPAAGPPIPQPGTLGSLGPTLRPGEPITHGLSTGPGAGPEIFQQFQPDPLVQAKVLLSSIPAVHQTPALRALSAAVGASMANTMTPTIAQGPQ